MIAILKLKQMGFEISYTNDKITLSGRNLNDKYNKKEANSLIKEIKNNDYNAAMFLKYGLADNIVYQKYNRNIIDCMKAIENNQRGN